MATRYRYRAVDGAGRPRRGEREAAGEAALAAELSREGVTLLRARPRRRGGERLTGGERIELCFVLAQLLRAGLPLAEAVAELEERHHPPAVRRVATPLRRRLEGGATLSAALAELPGAFDPLFVALVAVGEHTGTLPEVVERLHEELRWRADLAARTRRLLLYPLFTLAVVGGVALFLLLEVVPGMLALGASLGRAPPTESRWLIALSHAIGGALPWLAMGLPPLLLAVALTIRRSEWLQTLWDRWLLRWWWIGPQLRRAALARLARALALMYGAGLPLLEAVTVAERVAGNRALAAAVARVRRAISEGRPLSDGFVEARLFPPLLVRMVALGERGGSLDQALVNVAELQQRELRDGMERAQSMMEPLLTLILGGLLGWIVLAVMGPLFDLIGTAGV